MLWLLGSADQWEEIFPLLGAQLLVTLQLYTASGSLETSGSLKPVVPLKQSSTQPGFEQTVQQLSCA
jgi:hypothetical protein